MVNLLWKQMLHILVYYDSDTAIKARLAVKTSGDHFGSTGTVGFCVFSLCERPALIYLFHATEFCQKGYSLEIN